MGIAASQPGDTCLFVYGGHGNYSDMQGNRMGARNEQQYLCCTEGSGNGDVLWDHELEQIVNRAQPGVKVLLIIMSCYSGYMARQPFRFNSRDKPKPDGTYQSDDKKFLARYESWSQKSGWFTVGTQFLGSRTRANMTALQKRKRPFIICLSASEYTETADVDQGALPAFTGFGKYSTFTVRMIQYMFGDTRPGAEKHRQENWRKPIGQQFYMSLDTPKMGHTPVMTSNVQFDVTKFSVLDFFRKRFEQDDQGTYHYYDDPNWVSLDIPKKDKHGNDI